MSHEWFWALWALGRDAPGELPEDEFITEFRLRLGADPVLLPCFCLPQSLPRFVLCLWTQHQGPQ